jgi:2-polyprenyl-3-methyl-5-hydroxy-6-metoxy-1,4-benzoquinol methylase
MKATCQVCRGNNWLNLPDPVPDRAITTAGRIVNEPLGKAQCAECGFVQRIHARFLGDTDYYEQDYAKYYERPGTTQFHLARYRVLAEWMTSVLPALPFRRILDVGCGQGWAMEAMRAFYPDATIEGLEPSTFNSEVARAKGFQVYEARAGKAALLENKYDLVFSNNVIQHVTNAREFVASLKEVVTDDGVIVITCPDGSIPNIEILWSDQNFSFLPAHLIRLCEERGLKGIRWFSSPPSPSVPPAQMLLLSKDGLKEGKPGMTVVAPNLQDVYKAKCDYLNSFGKIDSHIRSRTERVAYVYNFGASYWSSILAAYCPTYWPKVSACIVEDTGNVEPQFLDKCVMALNQLQHNETDALVLGTSPATHQALRARFVSSWNTIVSWDDFLQY